MKGSSFSVTSVNIEMLHRVILCYIQSVHEEAKHVTNVNLDLLTRVILHVT